MQAPRWSIRLSSAAAFLILAPSGATFAARAPGPVDAACEALDLRVRSVASRATPRELDFFLFDAAALGCTGLAERLLDLGVSVVARNRGGNTALLIAARSGQEEMLDLLRARGAHVMQRNLDGATALLLAAMNNERRLAIELLDVGIDPNLADKQGLTPLLGAAFNGNGRLVEALLNAGADPMAVDASGKSAIVYAAGRGYTRVVEQLLDNDDVDANRRYASGLTALMWAAGYSNDVPALDGLATIELLLERGADFSAVDERGKSALSIAVERGHADVVSRLLDSGANAAIIDAEGKSLEELADGNAAVTALLDAYRSAR